MVATVTVVPVATVTALVTSVSASSMVPNAFHRWPSWESVRKSVRCLSGILASYPERCRSRTGIMRSWASENRDWLSVVVPLWEQLRMRRAG